MYKINGKLLIRTDAILAFGDIYTQSSSNINRLTEHTVLVQSSGWKHFCHLSSFVR